MSLIPPTDTAGGASCAACAEPLSSRFCAECGERRPSVDDERIGPFLRDQFHEVTSADGKLWRTVRGLFVPGKLTDEFFAGRRSLYVRPVRVFLVINVILFFLLRENDGTILKGPLQSNFDAALYGPTAGRLATDAAAAWGTNLTGVQAAFDAHATSFAPTLLGLLIPTFAVLFGLVMWPARARAVRHLVFATHTVSALLAGTLLLMVVLEISINAVRSLLGVHFDSMDPVLIPATVTGFSVYLGLSLRRVYGVRSGYAAGAGILLGTVGFAFAFWVYRLVLFFVTIWTLDAPAG